MVASKVINCYVTQWASTVLIKYSQPYSSKALLSLILSSIFVLNVAKLGGTRILYEFLCICQVSVVCPDTWSFEFIINCTNERTRNDGHWTRFTLSHVFALKQATLTLRSNVVINLEIGVLCQSKSCYLMTCHAKIIFNICK